MNRKLIAMLVASTVTVGCSSVPVPPVPDESRKVPANDRRELAALQCSMELSQTKTALNDALRLAERSTAQFAAARVEVGQMQAAVAAKAAPAPAPASQIFVVLYKHGSVTFDLNEIDAARLLRTARGAQHIEIRGRTDGAVETPAESRIARQRAEKMLAFLARNGVDATRINATWQPVGDHLGPNDDPEGRALNRRVEVEAYAVRPSRSALPLPTIVAEKSHE